MEPTTDQHVLRLATPQPFIETSTPFEDWNKWRERYELFEIGSEIASKSPSIRRASLLTILGSSAYETYKTFDFPSDQQGDTQTTKHILDAFTDYYKPYKNVTYASYEFNKLVQTADQPVMEFIKHLKILAEHCEFGLLKDRLIRDRIVIGIRDDVLRQRLLRETDPKLSQVIQMCLAAEISHKQGQAIIKSSPFGEPHIEGITSARSSRQPPARPRSTREGTADQGPTTTNLATPNRPCSRCGSHHKPRNCPAYGKTCFNCGMQGHFSQVCRQPRVQELNMNNYSSSPTSIPRDDILYLDVLQHKETPTTTTNTWQQDVEINRSHITFKLDTGADVNLIPQRYINNWPSVHIVPTSQQILTYTGQSIPILGTCELLCTTNGKTHVLHFVVAKLNAKPILGAEACVRMGFIQRIQAISEPTPQENAHDLIDKCDSVFTGQGRLPGTYITLRPDPSPAVVLARKVPIAVEPLLNKELQRMQDDDVTPVTQPTEWVNVLVIVDRKNGRIRSCQDPRPLNKVILRKHFHLPSEEELLSNISGATIFTVLDASNGFWHLSLDEPSSLLCTFATTYGRYRFLVLPFGGIASVPEMFQQEMVDVFASEEHPFFDYLLTAGLDSQDHDQLLERALQLSQISNLKLSKNKLQLANHSVRYVLAGNGLEADALSGAPTSPLTQSQATQAEESIHECLLVHISDARLQQMRDAALTDPVLQSLLVYIRDGWPSDPSKLSREAEQYTHCANELHVNDGLVCRASRVIIPQSQRQDVLRQLHVSHRGLTSTQRHARETVYWPGITKDIHHTTIISYDVCQRKRNSPAKEPLLDCPLPTRPWQHSCADYFHLNSTTFLILADVFSKFIEVVPITSTAAIPLIASYKTIYARYDFTEEPLTDNGSPFDSATVAAFHKKYAIPVQLSNGASPAELLMGRRLRSAVPMLPHLLEPQDTTSEAPRPPSVTIKPIRNATTQSHPHSSTVSTTSPFDISHRPTYYCTCVRRRSPAPQDDSVIRATRTIAAIIRPGSSRNPHFKMWSSNSHPSEIS